MLIDSHAHLYFKDFSSDFDSVVENAQRAGVEKIINIGTNLEDSQQAIDLSGKYDFMFATVGIHPSDDISQNINSINWAKFESLGKSPKVVGIGECGLDYSRIKAKGLRSNEEENEIDRQKKLFQKQIEIAQRLGLPVSIHVRDAQEDIINEFWTELQKCSGVFHCFSGEQRYLEFILSRLPGFYISFAGNLTFKNADNLRELAKLAPIEKILVETDCPFLNPEPNRGKRNEPAGVKTVAEMLAELKGLSFAQIAKITSDNAERLFSI